MRGVPPTQIPPASPGPQQRWQQLRHVFVEESLRSILALVFLAMPVSLTRSLAIGWQPLYSLHIGISVVYLGLYCMRSRMPLAVKASIPILIYWTLAVGALLTWGLVGNGVFALTILNLMTALVCPPRVTIWMIVASLSVLASIAAAIVSGHIVPFVNASEYALQASSWATTWILLCVVLMTIFRSLGIFQQSTQDLLQEIQEQQDAIIYLANHDQLTGLPLMRLARDRFEVAARCALQNGTKLAVLFVDLDGFKEINDSCGHEVGDCVLREIAQRIRSKIRAEDVAARIGGDEFLAIFGGVSEPQSIVDRSLLLLDAVRQPILCGARQVSLGASIGIALYPDHASDLDDLRGLADGAMYQAKRSGSNVIRMVEAPDWCPLTADGEGRH